MDLKIQRLERSEDDPVALALWRLRSGVPQPRHKLLGLQRPTLGLRQSPRLLKRIWTSQGSKGRAWTWTGAELERIGTWVETGTGINAGVRTRVEAWDAPFRITSAWVKTRTGRDRDVDRDIDEWNSSSNS